MIIERAEDEQFLANAYLIADEPGGSGVLVDSNGVAGPLLDHAEREGIDVTHVLVTHPHWDHVLGIAELAERAGAPILAHPEAADEIEAEAEGVLEHGHVLETGGLRIEAIAVPGHSASMVALNVNGGDCLTADCLFKGTVGGTGAPGASGFDDQRDSIMERLMKLPAETRLHPGHREPTTVGEEWEHNPFIRIWRGLDEEGTQSCSVGFPGSDEEPRRATLVLWAPDYDGGNKAWVRYADDGADAIVGGSMVSRD